MLVCIETIVGACKYKLTSSEHGKHIKRLTTASSPVYVLLLTESVAGVLKSRFLPLLPFCSKTQRKAVTEGLWFCTWPPVPSLWVQSLLHAHRIALYPPAL